LAAWLKERRSDREIQYRPARVLMQDFTGVPAVVDLAAMRAAMAKAGGDPQRINPLSPVDLVIDHSVMVDRSAAPPPSNRTSTSKCSATANATPSCAGARAPSTTSAWCRRAPASATRSTSNTWAHGLDQDEDGRTYAFPDTLVGTDSHTTMINGLGVLGWGVGGIEAEAACSASRCRC
jgi:aconitate hydratase